MRLRQLQIVFLVISLLVWPGSLPAAAIFRVEMTDVDGQTLSTADGHITVVVLSRSSALDKVRLVGDRIPDSCLGDPSKRFITLLTFETQHAAPARMVVKAMARHRLDGEAKRLQLRYNARKLSRDPRKDVFAVLDFDRSISARMDVAPSLGFQVLVFGHSGELLARWNDVPSAPELAAFLE